MIPPTHPVQIRQILRLRRLHELVPRRLRNERVLQRSGLVTVVTLSSHLEHVEEALDGVGDDFRVLQLHLRH